MIDIDKLIEEYESDTGPAKHLCHEAAQALKQQRKAIANLEGWNKEMYDNFQQQIAELKELEEVALANRNMLMKRIVDLEK